MSRYGTDSGADHDGSAPHEHTTAAVPNETYSVHVTAQSAGMPVQASNPHKNAELNDTARNTNDVEKIRRLVIEGAELVSNNGPEWRHTPMHQAAYHNRPQIIKVLIELCREQNLLDRILDMESNPCGRGARGTPIELARGGGHGECAALLERAAETISEGPTTQASNEHTWAHMCGSWSEHSNIDMCGQGDVEIIGDWKATHSIEDLKRIVEQKGYSAITVSAGQPSFGHAALKKFSYQLRPSLCKPISTCCKHPCTIYIYNQTTST